MATTTKKNGKVICPECKRLYASGYLVAHRRTAHGVYGGRSGRIRKRNGVTPVAQIGGMKVMEDFKVLQDDNGNIWIAERVR